MSTPLPDSEVSRVLVVSAHPDDVDFGAAGSVRAWTGAGMHVMYCIVTDGQSGGFDPSVPRDEMVRTRHKEQREAAAHVGVEDVRFLGYVDGELEPTRALVRDICRLIRELRPQRMVVPSPERDYEHLGRSHPDHLAAGKAALDAIYPAARNPFAHPELLDEGLEPWTVTDTWLMAHPTGNHHVDVTEAFESKLAAILAHESQHEDPEALAGMVRSGFAAAARAAGFPDGSYVETFHVIRTG